MEKYPYEANVSEFLRSLSEADLFALANTVSQGMLKQKIQDADGAISVILKHSSNTESILRRKLISKEILFNYLDDKDVTIPKHTTKDALIDKLLHFWANENIKICKEANTEVTPVIQNFYNIYVSPEQNINEGRDEAGELALKFSEWFYSIMNANDIIPVEHFYPDAKLKLSLISNTDSSLNNLENDPYKIVQHLHDTKLKHSLMFNPNLSQNGVKGKITPHGLVLVAACGSLHVHNQCVGVFEQVFGLAKDPSAENNWKIKYTELNLRNQSGVTALPVLETQVLEGPQVVEITECG